MLFKAGLVLFKKALGSCLVQTSSITHTHRKYQRTSKAHICNYNHYSNGLRYCVVFTRYTHLFIDSSHVLGYNVVQIETP